MQRQIRIDTPVGRIGIAASDRAVTRIFFCDTPRAVKGEPRRTNPPEMYSPESAPPLLREAVRQIGEYFAGTRRTFTLPLEPAGTPFQLAVWEALRRIPYGQTRTYGEIARQVGRPSACRAVGMANNRNPIVIAIPCHRVVGADGRLVGFAGGLEVKSQLLQLERSGENLPLPF